MPKAMIEDWDAFNAYLAAQPLFKWLEQKQRESFPGMPSGRGQSSAAPARKNDNADLAAALSSMA